MSILSREAIRVEGVAVSYGATRALVGVDLCVAFGSVHAVVGENGAGKSTLLRVLTGQVAPHAGRVEMVGRARAPRGPAEAERWGVALAAQEIDLCDELSVCEQVTLGRESRSAGLLGRLGFIDRRAEIERAAALLARVGADVDPRARVSRLGASRKKQVQIARALASDPRVLLLDEPTAALDGQGQEGIRRLLEVHLGDGGAAVLISHRIEEVLELADTITVLRDGARVATAPARELDGPQIVHAMVGRVLGRRRREGVEPEPGRAGSAEGAATLPGEPRIALTDAGPDLAPVCAGEIVGLAGLVGAGRSRVLEAIARREPHAVALVPEERKTKGLVPTFRVRENIFVRPDARWIDSARERSRADRWISELAIRTSGSDAPIGSLSGGNQQKVLLARALARDTGRILLDEPTQGVDVGAKADIHDTIRRLAQGGAAIVVASSDVAELLALTDRIVVMRDGAAVAVVPTAEATEPIVVGLAAGVEAA